MKHIRLFFNSILGFVFSLLTIAGNTAHSQELDQLALYARCYNHLTGKPLPLTHPLRAGLTTGSVDARTKCKELLAKGKLNASSHLANSGDSESLAVLRHMFDLHKTWFAAVDFRQMNFFENHPGIYDLYDPAEGALALTYVMLSENNEPYRNVLRNTFGYFPLRVITPSENDRFIQSRWFMKGADPIYITHDLPSRVDEATPNRYKRLSEPLISVHALGATDFSHPANQVDMANRSITLSFDPIRVGELNGIQPDPRSTILANYTPAVLWRQADNIHSSLVKNESVTTTPGLLGNIPLFGSRGGGVMGLPSFMTINWGLAPGVPNDGAVQMPRRWAQRALETFLCKDLPVLRSSDVASYMDATGATTVAPFRKSSSCLQCHATMDQLAASARNHIIGYSNWPLVDHRVGNVDPSTNPMAKIVKKTTVVGQYSVGAADAGWLTSPQANFMKQSPNGKLYFRSFSGALVNQTVTGIQQAGVALSNSDDYFQCAAKRYFQHFTGINVKLYDRGDPRFSELAATLTPNEIKLRKFIETLGADFKSDPNQSTIGLIEKIIDSPYYSDLNFAPGAN